MAKEYLGVFRLELNPFPKIGDSTTFVKQEGNLSYWINRLHQAVAAKLGAMSDSVHITYGFPVPVC